MTLKPVYFQVQMTTEIAQLVINHFDLPMNPEGLIGRMNFDEDFREFVNSSIPSITEFNQLVEAGKVLFVDRDGKSHRLMTRQTAMESLSMENRYD